MNLPRSFASDNSAGVHPKILQAIVSANQGHAIAYGEDPFTESAVRKFQEHFGDNIEVAFVFNGTGANVVGLSTITRSFHSILCSEVAHINVDECNAPERLAGCKLVPIPTEDGKLTIEQIQPYLRGFGVEHHAQPGVISITQTTEFGTVYRPQEIQVLADFAHRHGLLIHMDGARLSNAAASLDVPLRQITTDVGVDVLSFGGTKNGMMFGEAVIFFDRQLAETLRYFRKQCTQLASKMRFIAAQFEALLSNDLWLTNAQHANLMAQRLAEGLTGIPEIAIMQPVEANAIFAAVPKEIIPSLQEHYYFYVWDEPRAEVRWMTAFDTTEEDVRAFIEAIKKARHAAHGY